MADKQLDQLQMKLASRRAPGRPFRELFWPAKKGSPSVASRRKHGAKRSPSRHAKLFTLIQGRSDRASARRRLPQLMSARCGPQRLLTPDAADTI
jgi:hypothetical protein